MFPLLFSLWINYPYQSLLSCTLKLHKIIFQSSGVISVLITKISNSAGNDHTGKCCDATPNKFGKWHSNSIPPIKKIHTNKLWIVYFYNDKQNNANDWLILVLTWIFRHLWFGRVWYIFQSLRFNIQFGRWAMLVWVITDAGLGWKQFWKNRNRPAFYHEDTFQEILGGKLPDSYYTTTLYSYRTEIGTFIPLVIIWSLFVPVFRVFWLFTRLT